MQEGLSPPQGPSGRWLSRDPRAKAFLRWGRPVRRPHSAPVLGGAQGWRPGCQLPEEATVPSVSQPQHRPHLVGHRGPCNQQQGEPLGLKPTSGRERGSLGDKSPSSHRLSLQQRKRSSHLAPATARRCVGASE